MAFSSDARLLIRNRLFGTLWLSQLVSTFGDAFTLLALQIAMHQETASPRSVGLLVLIQTLPRLLLALPGGMVADRYNRVKVMVIVDLARGLIVAVLALAPGTLNPNGIYAAAFLLSLGGALFSPALMSMVPNLIPERSQLISANGLLQAGISGTMLIGPSMAGLTIAFWGVRSAFLVDSASFLASAAIMATLITARGLGLRTSKRRLVGGTLGTAVQLLRHSPVLSRVLLLITVLVFSLALRQALLVPLLRGELGASARQIGWISSAVAAGTMFGGVFVAPLSRSVSLGWLIGTTTLMIAFAVGLIGAAHSAMVVMSLLVLAAAATSIIQAAVNAVAQATVPDQFRGRAAGVFATITTTARLLGLGLNALFVDFVGVRQMFTISAFLVAACAPLGLSIRAIPLSPVAVKSDGALDKSIGMAQR